MTTDQDRVLIGTRGSGTGSYRSAGQRPSGWGVSDCAEVSVVARSVLGMALGLDERQRFLAEPHVGSLSVAGGLERAPLTVPIWYGYEPGGELWVQTPATSRKAALILAAGRFTMLVHRVQPTVRYVSVEGPMTRIVPESRDDLVALVRRYLPADAVPEYVAMAEREHGERVVIGMSPHRWLSADLG